MRKRVLGFLFTVFLYLGVPSVAYAAEPVRICELEQVIANLFNLVIALTPFIGLAILVYGAVIWMTATADPQKMQQAQHTLTYGVIGLVLGLSAVLVVVTIESFLLGGEVFRWSDGISAFVQVKICADDAEGGGGDDGGSEAFCTTDSECDLGLTCEPIPVAGGEKECVPEPGKSQEGQSCITNVECARGLVCVDDPDGAPITVCVVP